MTDKCNQACTYCAASAQPDQISVSNLDNNYHILSKIVDFIVRYSESSFYVEFQGGEPLLNLPTLQYIVDEISERAIKLNKKPNFRLVSNLTLLNPDIADYIALKDIEVSTSLDGLEFLHNKHRKLRVGENSYTRVVEGINQLRCRGVKVGILTVITQDALEVPEDIVDNLAKLRIYRLMIKPVFQIGYAEKSWKALGMDPESYSYFWKRFVKRCFAYHLQNIPILDYTTELLVRKIMMVQEPNYVDLKSPCGCIHGQIAYDFQGNIYPCDEARFNQKIILGNVLYDSFDEISQSQEAFKIINASIIDTNRCGLCSYRPWCGRCPVINRMHFCEYDVPSEKTYGCHIWKCIFDRFFELVAEDPESIRFVESMIKGNDILRSLSPSIFDQKSVRKSLFDLQKNE